MMNLCALTLDLLAQVRLAPHEVLFCAGEPSDSGIFIVVRI